MSHIRIRNALDDFDGLVDRDISVEGDHIEAHKLVIRIKLENL